jgi:hypothetical protein
LFAVFLKATGSSVELALSISPVGALFATGARANVVTCAGLWATAGVVLLALTHRRERHAMI